MAEPASSEARGGRVQLQPAPYCEQGVSISGALSVLCDPRVGRKQAHCVPNMHVLCGQLSEQNVVYRCGACLLGGTTQGPLSPAR